LPASTKEKRLAVGQMAQGAVQLEVEMKAKALQAQTGEPFHGPRQGNARRSAWHQPGKQVE
jgi:hypothetical protein